MIAPALRERSSFAESDEHDDDLQDRQGQDQQRAATEAQPPCSRRRDAVGGCRWRTLQLCTPSHP